MFDLAAGGSGSEIEAHLSAASFHGNPYPIYDRLRREAPVYFSESWNGSLLSGYRQVKAILEQPERFSSAGRVRERMRALPDHVWTRMEEIYGGFQGFFWSDPPEYTAHRALMGRMLRPRIAHLEARITAIVDDAIDAIATKGRMDAIGDLAYPLPATVIFDLLGIPLRDRDLFRTWAAEMIQLARIVDPSIARSAMESMDRAVTWVRSLLAERARKPRDDMLSALAAELPVAAMSDREARVTAVTLIQLLLAGHETTTNLIGNGLFTLLSHPDQAARLFSDPSLVPRAVEEMLRYESPLQYLTRRATEEIELEGERIPRDGLVLVLIGSANRDPAQFPKPDVFDVARRPNRHLAFGFGVHFCLGAPLARLEARIAFERLLARLDGLELVEPGARWRANPMFRGLESLPVRFSDVR